MNSRGCPQTQPDPGGRLPPHLERPTGGMPVGAVWGNKTVVESPFMLPISVFEALRDAVAQAGGQPKAMNAPATADEVLRSVSPRHK